MRSLRSVSRVFSFSLSVLFGATAGSAQTAEAAEPNDAPALATALPCGVHGYGHLDVGGDVDVWSFTVTEPLNDLVAYTTSRGATQIAIGPGGTSASDTVLELIDVDGSTVLASNDDYFPERSFEESGFFSSVRVRAVPAGTYYLAVRGWSPIEFGDYAVEVFCRTSDGPLVFCTQFGDGPLEIEPNDSASASGVLPANCCERVFGTLPPGVGGGPGVDSDWWRLALVEDMIVQLDVVGDTSVGNPVVDPEVLVYNADGSVLIAQDDDSGLALNASLRAALPAGDYRVCVRGVPNGAGFEVGDYSLRVDCAPSPAPIVAEIRVDAVPGPVCTTSGGRALRLVPRKNEFAQIGGQFFLDVDGFVGIPAVILFAIDTPLLTPIDLALIGAPECFLSVDPIVSALPTFSTVPGESEFGFSIPDDPLNLEGRVQLQAAVIDLLANPFGLVTSNRVLATIGNDA